MVAAKRPFHGPPKQRVQSAGGDKRQVRVIRVRGDKLGTYVRGHAARYKQLNWRDFIREARGAGDLKITEEARSSHPAGDLLMKFEKNGVPTALSSAPLSAEERARRMSRGPHKSCMDHLDFLREELLDYVEKGFWILLPYSLLKDLQDLRLSPMGVVPQRGRRPRIIVDYSYYGVNKDTLRLTPPEAMQFGRALERILHRIRNSNPNFGPVHLGKVDLSDGFYRLYLSDSSILKLAVAFPQYPGEEQLVALPLSIPMGWVESPPAFCIATETVADLNNNHHPHRDWPEHPLEAAACTPPEDQEAAHEPDQDSSTRRDDSRIPPVITPQRRPVAFTDVYVDDFILGFQGHSQKRRLYLRQLLHTIDMVFRPLEPTDRPTRKSVVSVKKLLKGDAYMSVTKTVLGWFINTVNQTIELPDHRKERLLSIFDYLHRRSSVPLKKWQKILGELRSMVIGIPGSRGLFSMLQHALQQVDAAGNIHLTTPLKDQLADFHHLATELTSRPTALAEIVPDYPVAMGPHDASGTGMGGVWLPSTTNSNITPIMWREQFPEDIIKDLVSFNNPHGTVNNSQLELAGQIAHQDVLAQEYNCEYRTITPFGDNTNAVAWTHKGSATTDGPTAYLLRLNSLHQRHFRYLSKPDYIPGVYNQMADDLSRLWHLSDSQMLLYFTRKYPQPQPWRLVKLRPEMQSSLTSALRMKRSDLQSVLNATPNKMAIGTSGHNSARPLVKTRTWKGKTSPSSYIFSRLLAYDYARETLLPSHSLEGLEQWRTTYVPSRRRLPAWGPKTRV